MMNMILMILIALNTINNINSESIINTYKDYQTTIENIGLQYQNNYAIMYTEANPIANKVFELVNYKPYKLDIIGAIYLLAVNELNYFPRGKMLNKCISIMHFHGAYSWRNAPHQVMPEIIYVTFRIAF